MYLTRLLIDPRNRQARRDLSNPYDMHRTLSRAFVADEHSTPARFLWRQEVLHSGEQHATLLVQSAQPAAWQQLQLPVDYFAQIEANKPLQIEHFLQPGRRCRFRLLANPTVTRNRKRLGLLAEAEQLAWLARQGERAGFALYTALTTANYRLTAHKGAASPITVQAVCFEGELSILDAQRVSSALLQGIGHAKMLGLGLLSLAPAGVGAG